MPAAEKRKEQPLIIHHLEQEGNTIEKENKKKKGGEGYERPYIQVVEGKKSHGALLLTAPRRGGKKGLE